MATATTETTALATVESQSREMAVSAQEAMAQREIEGAIMVAQRFPRNEDTAFERVMRSCERYRFAELARYSFPRGGQQVEGPSVNLAREIARCWGNIRYGVDVIHDDADSRTIRAWAWDVQTNTRRSQDATFRKLMFRKGKGWVAPDERDLREVTNKHGETAVRNCLLHLVPPDLVDDAMVACKETMRKDAAKDPDEARKKLIRAFQHVGVTVEDLEMYLGHPVRQVTAEEIADLRGVWSSISDGNSTWKEYVKDREPAKTESKTVVPGPVTMADLTGSSSGIASPAVASHSHKNHGDGDAIAFEIDLSDRIATAQSLTDVNTVEVEIDKSPCSDQVKQALREAAERKRSEIRGQRGGRSNGK